MNPTTTDDVFDLMDAYITAAALNAAMELGLFWLLAEQPLDAPGVAQTLDIPLNRCRYWLQIFSRLGLVEQGAGGYALSATAQSAILDAYSQETWAFLAQEARLQFPVIRDLTLHLHEPGSVWEVLGLTPPDYFSEIVASSESAQRFTRMLYEIHLPLADGLAEYLDTSGVNRLLDLGGGSGVVSLALLRRYPQLTALVVDIPNVCAVGREIAQENALAERITYQAIDFLRDELPTGFDLILQCDVGPYQEAFFEKLRVALNPGGRLVIADQFAPAEGVAPPSRLRWAFEGSLSKPDFAFPTAAQVQALLTRAGFQLLSQGVVPQRATPRWFNGWMVIEARK